MLKAFRFAVVGAINTATDFAMLKIVNLPHFLIIAPLSPTSGREFLDCLE